MKKEEIPRDLLHNYALALRDSGRVDEAVEIFKRDAEMNDLENWNPDSGDDISANIGNIGRCFYLKNDLQKALIFTEKSARFLKRGETKTERINYGYALLWIADIFIAMNRYEDACKNIQEAISVWNEYAPARIMKVKSHLASYPKKFLNEFGECIKV